jgi:hypothetical protein
MSPKAQQAKMSAAEEELDANDLLWLPADSEPVSSDFLGLSRPDASLVPPPINVPAPDPLDSRDGKATALEAAMAFRVRVAPMPDVSATTRPVSKDSVAPPERKSVVCTPWVIAASLLTAAGYFIFTQRATPVEPMSYTSPAPVEHVATQPAALPPPVEAPELPVAETKSAPEQGATPLPAPPDTAASAAEAKPAEAPPDVPSTQAVQPNPTTKTPTPSIAERPAAPPKRERVESAPLEKPREASHAVSSLKQETTATEPFDKVAAMAALEQAAANASACRKEGDPSGTAEVRVTFSTSGRATQAVLSGPPFAGTMTGSCIATAMRAARMPPFIGERTTVQKRVIIK